MEHMSGEDIAIDSFQEIQMVLGYDFGRIQMRNFLNEQSILPIEPIF